MSENTAVVAENKPKGKFLNNDKRAFRAILWGILSPVIAVVVVIVAIILIVVGAGVSASGGNNAAGVGIILFGSLLFLAIVGVAITALVFNLMWVYRAHKNAETISGEELFLSAGWHVGFYFIPLANLVVPYLLMLRIAEKSSSESSRSVVLSWWICMGVSFVLSFGSTFLSLASLPAIINAGQSGGAFPVDGGLGIAGTGLSWIANLASFAGFILSFFVISTVTKGQKEKADELGFLTVEDKMEA
jgi:Domain of unknown function (DUF4328)